MNKYNNPRLTNTTIAGSGMKHPVRPHVILGNPENGYIQGDIMDANAVAGAVNTQLNEMFDGAPDALDTIGELVQTVKDTSESIEKIDNIVDTQIGPKYHLLDYLFTDGTTNSELVEGKTPVAICVGEASEFTDGKARFMAIKVPLLDGTAVNSFSLGTVALPIVSQSGALTYQFCSGLKSAGFPEIPDRSDETVYRYLNGWELTNALYSYLNYTYGSVSDYPAIKAAKEYNDGGFMQGEWYLPAAGELLRAFKPNSELPGKISFKIQKANGCPLRNSDTYWTCSFTEIRTLSQYDYGLTVCEKSPAASGMNHTTATVALFVRPFLRLNDTRSDSQAIVDYDETDSNSVSFIKNKPLIKSEDYYGNVYYDTTGAIRVKYPYNSSNLFSMIDDAGFFVNYNGITYATLSKDGVSLYNKTSNDILTAGNSTILKGEFVSDWNLESSSSLSYIRNKPTKLSDFIYDISLTTPKVGDYLYSDYSFGKDPTNAIAICIIDWDPNTKKATFVDLNTSALNNRMAWANAAAFCELKFNGDGYFPNASKFTALSLSGKDIIKDIVLYLYNQDATSYYIIWTASQVPNVTLNATCYEVDIDRTRASAKTSEYYVLPFVDVQFEDDIPVGKNQLDALIQRIEVLEGYHTGN